MLCRHSYYDEIECDSDYQSLDHRELIKNVDHAKDHMEGLLGELCGKTELDLNACTWYLEEICHVLGIKDFNPLTICRG